MLIKQFGGVHNENKAPGLKYESFYQKMNIMVVKNTNKVMKTQQIGR